MAMRVGLVGGYGHECLKAFPGGSFAWAEDGFDGKAREKARAFGNACCYASLEEMIEKFSPQLIYIGSVYAMNGRLAMKALEAGFSVVSEKPLACDRETLAELRRLTADGRRQCIAEFAMRWHPPVVQMRKRVQSGAIGKVISIHAQKSYQFGLKRPDFYGDRALFGGIIPWVASHAIDFVSWCTGLDYESVSAVHGNLAHPDYPGMEDYASLLFTMEGGVSCTITADFLRPDGASSHADDRLKITGSEGILEMTDEEIRLWDSKGEQHWECEGLNGISIPRAIDFVEAASGKSSARISTRESLAMTTVALAAREAADTGKKMQIVDQKDFYFADA